MAPALDLAMGLPPRDELRQIVFITDGSVGNETELLQLQHRVVELTGTTLTWSDDDRGFVTDPRFADPFAAAGR